ncbi:tetratricopeptide repeat protein 38-like isoform X1 [Argonauta hians]
MNYCSRDRQAWKTFGMDMSTPSDEACKLFDINLNQLARFCNDETVGGIPEICTKMYQADPEFVMGHVFEKSLSLIGHDRNILTDSAFQQEVKKLQEMRDKSSTVTEWESRHVDAIVVGAMGDFLGSCEIWEEILRAAPLDLLALKLATFTYYYLGQVPLLHQSVARVMPHWTPSVPNHGYVHGMMAFGFEENNMFAEAEEEASKALSVNQTDIWASHAQGHVWEMLGDFQKGIHYFEKTEKDWSSCDMLSTHVYWHWAVFHIEKGDFASAMDIYKKSIQPSTSIVDQASLLYRLQLEDVDCSEEWKAAFNLCPNHLQDHSFIFQDLHILMTLLAVTHDDDDDDDSVTDDDGVDVDDDEEEDLVSKFIASITNTSSENVPQHKYYQKVAQEVGGPVCKALVAYKEGHYEQVVDLMEPVRHLLPHLGGSNAQRDVLILLLIVSAMKSSRQTHRDLANSLLNERKAMRKTSPLADRLMLRTKSLARTF